MMDVFSQQNKQYIKIKSKMWFVSEPDYSRTDMDEEGNQVNYDNNYIIVYNRGKKIKIPYDSKFIFWDNYDKNMNVKKKKYIIILELTSTNDLDSEKKVEYKLYKVFDAKKLIYDITKKNPFNP